MEMPRVPANRPWPCPKPRLVRPRPCPAAPAAQKFVGSWKLISYEYISSAGEVSYPRGREPIGRITYDAAGRMSVQMMQPGRPKSDGIVQDEETPEQMIAAYRGYSAYFGTYTVDETRG